MSEWKKELKLIPCREIAPQGWIYRRLLSLADGLSGHIDEIWEDVGPQNAWLGGRGDDWERGPYYFDGLAPLAELLPVVTLKEKENLWIEELLNSQQADGFFGPSSNKDWWPRLIVMKTMTNVAASHDDEPICERITSFLVKAVAYLEYSLTQDTLEMWSYARAMELCPTLFWLINKTGEMHYLELGKKVGKSSLDWVHFFETFPLRKPMQEIMPWQHYLSLLEKEKKDSAQPTLLQRNHDRSAFILYHTSHGVNVAMALKYLAFWYQLTSDTKYLQILRNGVESLQKYHGQANGMFACDEHLSGLSPSQGTELCTVVELMFSIEEIIRITHDLSWSDWLETITFNALLTTISLDSCSHQYDQQVNQISCTTAPRDWYNNGDDSNTFGLAPNFGCCTANMHQGWPKFVQSAWMKDSDGYCCISYVPYAFSDQGITIITEGNYPFDNSPVIKIHGNGRHFTIRFHIPIWSAKNCSVSLNGESLLPTSDGVIMVERTWQDDEIQFNFNSSIRIAEVSGGCSVYWGAILFALPLKPEKKITKDRGRFSDFELTSQEKWNYGLCMDSVPFWSVGYEKRVIEGEERDIPTLHCFGKRVYNWGIHNNSADILPNHPDVKGQKQVALTLVPYGLTSLRIAVFPKLDTN
jgi:hypothetical protein